jgi:hypothetical protein
VCQKRGIQGCLKLSDSLGEFDHLLNGQSGKISEARTKISDQLKALADDAGDSSQGDCSQVEEVLRLAAELIEEGEGGLQDKEIVLLEDLD